MSTASVFNSAIVAWERPWTVPTKYMVAVFQKNVIYKNKWLAGFCLGTMFCHPLTYSIVFRDIEEIQL